MNTNQKNLVIADSPEEVRWAIKNLPEKTILSPLPGGQYELLKNNLPFDTYLNFLPSRMLVEKIVKTANDFALNWYKGTPLERELNYKNMNLAHYMVGYFTNLLIHLLTSEYVLQQEVSKYHPKNIYFFRKNIAPASCDNADSFVLDVYSKTNLLKGINIIPIDLPVAYKQGPRIPKSLRDILRYAVKDPRGTFIIAISIFERKILNAEYFLLKNSQVLYYADKYILIKSLPLLKTISSKFTTQVVTSMLTIENRLQLNKAGVNYIEFETLPHNNIDKALSKKILRVWKKFSKSKDYSRLLKTNGLINFRPVVSESIRLYFDLQIPFCQIAISRAENLINKVKPDVTLLAGNYGKRGLSLAYTTQINGGKAVLWEHGITSAPRQAHPPIYDKMLVWGDMTKKLYKKYLSEPESNMKTVGWFYVDSLTYGFKYIIKAVKPNNFKSKILFVLSYYGPDYPKELKIIKEVIEVLNADGEYELIVRPHENEYFPEDISFITNDAPNVKFSWDFGENLDKQINWADLIISQGTTVGLKAMFFQKPVIHLLTHDVTDITDLHKFGAALKVSSINQLIPAIKSLKNQTNLNRMFLGQKKLLKEYFYKLDNKSGLRVVKEIENFILRKNG